jgi:para-aminobenzoate synthetase component 1
VTAARVLEAAAWRDPLAVLASFAEEPYALALISDGSARGRWSYLGWAPQSTFSSLEAWRAVMPAPEPLEATVSDHPPFQGGAAGLACYEWGAAQEPAMPQPRSGWPDLAGGIYDKLLAFDHHLKRVWAIGRGGSEAEARARAGEALERLRANGPPPAPAHASRFHAVIPGQAHQAAVSAVVAAIGRGDLFQANIARPWAGRLERGCTPFDVLARLARESPAPFAGYLRLPKSSSGHGRAVVSNSPERFIEVTAEGQAQTRPIKGTRPRGATPDEDRRLAEELLASPKDRAENLMIVDLMRNDLARACRPGTVKVEAFCALETYANVHHLVSTVTGTLKPGQGALDLFSAAFPAGSITGAPKIQAMREIARHETPRGPYCGSLFWAGLDGAFDSSVLIRTLAFEEDAEGWTFETRAGGGITADSIPEEEDAEAEAKIAAIQRALTA